MIYTCVRCGKQFEAKHKTAVCSECHTAICVVCGKEFELKHPYTAKTCSSKCRGILAKQSGQGKGRAAKAKQTMLAKYGTDNPGKIEHVFHKVCPACGKEFETTSSRRKYCYDKHYGPCPACGKPVEILDMSVGPTACSEECRKKLISDTCLQRYQSTCAINSEHSRQLSRVTCLQRYGVEHYSQTQEYKQRYAERSANARNTEVVELTHEECKAFLDANHRQGGLSAKIRLGLQDKQSKELLAAMTFGKVRGTIGRRKEDSFDTMELSRFCTKINTSVVGGASKLFKHFIKTYQPSKVISFSDRAHTRGNLYQTLGFHAVSCTPPNYVWVNMLDDTFYNRVKTQKQHIQKLFPEDNTIDLAAQTEREIMESHNYAQVFDCGVIRWEIEC